MIFDIGDLIGLPATFVDINNVPTDPDTVTFYVQRYVEPLGAEEIFTYGTDAAVKRDGTGTYHLEYYAAAGGVYLWRKQGDGAVTQADEGWFEVRDSYFASVNAGIGGGGQSRAGYGQAAPTLAALGSLGTGVLASGLTGNSDLTLAPLAAVATGGGGTSPALYWGAYLHGADLNPAWGDAPWDTRPWDQFQTDAGKTISILHWGAAWSEGGVLQPFFSGDLEPVRLRGAIPMLNWNPWNLGDGVSQPAFRLSAIAGGAYDSYITSWATAARNWGHPFFLRPMDEMNGTWYPWAEAANGNAPGDFVLAWRHIFTIFQTVGATNVTFVWCPNTDFAGATPLSGLYPGSSYVHWTAIDGYNFPAGPWTPFADVFGDTYAQILALAPFQPLMIAETASTETGGSKAAWITDALSTQIPTTFPAIRALVWFNWNDGADWIIETSPSSQAAFAAAISAPRYRPGAFSSLPSGPIAPPTY